MYVIICILTEIMFKEIRIRKNIFIHKVIFWCMPSVYLNLYFHQVWFSFVIKDFFKHFFYSVDHQVMTFFCFDMFENILILPPVFIFYFFIIIIFWLRTEFYNQVDNIFFWNTLRTLLHCLLACVVSYKNLLSSLSLSHCM